MGEHLCINNVHWKRKPILLKMKWIKIFNEITGFSQLILKASKDTAAYENTRKILVKICICNTWREPLMYVLIQSNSVHLIFFQRLH